MAKRITSGKRDREKIKQQKRQEKLKRREERQSNTPRSFDEMLAYTDEYGILHSTPQEKPKEGVEVSEINISTPKQEEMEIIPLTGRVEYFNSAKGYGFIKDIHSSEKYFFHISSAPEFIAEGLAVTFEIERSARGMNAVCISVIENDKRG